MPCLGWAAENNGEQEVRVHIMRKLRCPYDQSCILGIPARLQFGSAQITLLVKGAPQFPQVMNTDFLPTIIFGDPAQIAFNAGSRGTSLSSCCGRPPPTKFRWHTSSESLFSLPHLDTRFPDFFFIQCRAPLGKTSIPAKKIIMWSQSCLKMFTNLFQNFTKLSHSCLQVFSKLSQSCSKWRQKIYTEWSPFLLSCDHEMR